MSKPVAVLGGGGHARVVIDVLRLMRRDIIGIIDPRQPVDLPPGLAWIGSDLSQLQPAEVELAIGVGSIDVGSKNPRPRLFDDARRAGFTLATLIHPSAILAGDARWGEGCQIMAGCVIQPGTVLGENVLVNTRASIDHDCRIAGNVHLAPGTVLSGAVTVGDGSHLGTGANVIQGIQIGREVMVAAGCTITSNLADFTRFRPQR
jgi:UDP-perosamine 4-acetyltransferase